MSGSPKSVILADDRPANLPLPEKIVQLCRTAGYDVRGIPLIDVSSGIASAWVKYGPSTSVTMGEALTQDWVAQVLNANPDAAVRIPKVYHAFEYGCFGYIVMEYIDGSPCDNSDAPQVAAAVQCLISVTGPTTAPGPVGGGPIVHRFFVEWTSSITSKRWKNMSMVFLHTRGCPNGSASQTKSAMAYVFALVT